MQFVNLPEDKSATNHKNMSEFNQIDQFYSFKYYPVAIDLYLFLFGNFRAPLSFPSKPPLYIDRFHCPAPRKTLQKMLTVHIVWCT